MNPIFSAILNFLDFCLYFFDIVSDVLTTKLFYDNCHYNYLAISISILASSYIITVIFLICIVHEKQKWYKALAYPFITLFVVFKKFLKQLPFCKCNLHKVGKPRESVSCYWLSQVNENWSYSQLANILHFKSNQSKCWLMTSTLVMSRLLNRLVSLHCNWDLMVMSWKSLVLKMLGFKLEV